jgi:hypothetical protein
VRAEWLQHPENVVAGHIGWNKYRGDVAPTAIRIFYHKTGAVVLRPLEDNDDTPFYADAEAVLAHEPLSRPCTTVAGSLDHDELLLISCLTSAGSQGPYGFLRALRAASDYARSRSASGIYVVSTMLNDRTFMRLFRANTRSSSNSKGD